MKRKKRVEKKKKVKKRRKMEKEKMMEKKESRMSFEGDIEEKERYKQQMLLIENVREHLLKEIEKKKKTDKSTRGRGRKRGRKKKSVESKGTSLKNERRARSFKKEMRRLKRRMEGKEELTEEEKMKRQLLKEKKNFELLEKKRWKKYDFCTDLSLEEVRIVDNNNDILEDYEEYKAIVKKLREEKRLCEEKRGNRPLDAWKRGGKMYVQRDNFEGKMSKHMVMKNYQYLPEVTQWRIKNYAKIVLEEKIEERQKKNLLSKKEKEILEKKQIILEEKREQKKLQATHGNERRAYKENTDWYIKGTRELLNKELINLKDKDLVLPSEVAETLDTNREFYEGMILQKDRNSHPLRNTQKTVVLDEVGNLETQSTVSTVSSVRTADLLENDPNEIPEVDSQRRRELFEDMEREDRKMLRTIKIQDKVDYPLVNPPGMNKYDVTDELDDFFKNIGMGGKKIKNVPLVREDTKQMRRDIELSNVGSYIPRWFPTTVVDPIFNENVPRPRKILPESLEEVVTESEINDYLYPKHPPLILHQGKDVAEMIRKRREHPHLRENQRKAKKRRKEEKERKIQRIKKHGRKRLRPRIVNPVRENDVMKNLKYSMEFEELEALEERMVVLVKAYNKCDNEVEKIENFRCDSRPGEKKDFFCEKDLLKLQGKIDKWKEEQDEIIIEMRDIRQKINTFGGIVS